MSIIIPSSKIYSKDQNIVKDNAISRIDVVVAKGNKVIENTSVHDQTLYFFSPIPDRTEQNTPKNRVNVKTYRADSGFVVWRTAVYLYHVVRFKKITIEIPIISAKSKVLSIAKDDLNDFFLPLNVSFTRVTKYTTDIYGTVAEGVDDENPSWTIYASGEPETQEVQEIPSFSEVVSHSYTDNNMTASIESDCFSLSQNTTFSNSYVQGDNIILEIYFPYETRIEKAQGSEKEATSESTANVDVTGVREVWFVNEADITVNGKKMTLNIDYETQVIGDGDKPWKTEQSELLQTTQNYQKTLEEYKNGKETIKILCSLGDYYDEVGNKVISALGDDDLPMTFKFYDKVIPYVRDAKGNDNPISFDSNGTRKEYSVVGVRKFYNGASWQEITVQESIANYGYYTMANSFGGDTYVILSPDFTKSEGTISVSATKIE